MFDDLVVFQCEPEKDEQASDSGVVVCHPDAGLYS